MNNHFSTPRPHRFIAVVAAGISLVALLAGCSSDSDAPSTTTIAQSDLTVTREAISPARCQLNRAAGKLTFLSPYDYAASAGIIDVVTAKTQGYFDVMCLDVTILPSDTGQIPSLLASGAAQFGSLGSTSEVAVANSSEAGLLALLQYGHTTVDQLVVRQDAGVTALADVAQLTIGVKGGGLPYGVQAMLTGADVDTTKLKTVNVGYALSEFSQGQTQAEGVYKSNEPRRLAEMNVAYLAFDPADYNVAGSFGVQVTTAEFASRNPTVVEDFARASLRGYEYAAANPDAAVTAALALADSSFFFSTESESFRWKTEYSLIVSSTKPGSVVGAFDLDAAEREIQQVRVQLPDRKLPDAKSIVQSQLATTLYGGGSTVVWPENAG